MEWFRWYHGAVSDDKWPLIARRSGQSVAVVVAVWSALLECASQAQERGSVADFDPESIDALLQLEDGAAQAVITALSEGKKPRIIAGRIANWEKRQPLRERDNSKSTERVRQHRERQKALQNQQETDCNADETPVKRQETPRSDKRREEEIRDHTLQGTTGDEGHTRARPGHEGESFDFSDVPGIEFQELRELYDREAKPEAPLAGFTEYKTLRASRSSWPGIGRITQGIDRLKREDAEWLGGFAPGLAKFLRERQWDKQPAPPRGARASPQGAPAQESLSPAEIAKRNAQAQQMLAAITAKSRKENRELLQGGKGV